LFFPYFFVSVPCTRLSWPSCQLFSAHEYTLSYRNYYCHLMVTFPGKPGSAGSSSYTCFTTVSLGISGTAVLWAGCPSCNTTISVKTLREPQCNNTRQWPRLSLPSSITRLLIKGALLSLSRHSRDVTINVTIRPRFSVTVPFLMTSHKKSQFSHDAHLSRFWIGVPDLS